MGGAAAQERDVPLAGKCIGLPMGGMHSPCYPIIRPRKAAARLRLPRGSTRSPAPAGGGRHDERFPDGDPHRSERGLYAEVEYGWSGTARPATNSSNAHYPIPEGCRFPERRELQAISYTISGSVMQPEVKMVGFPGRGGSATRAAGTDPCIVPMNWNGKVTPEKTAYQFDPPIRPYRSRGT